MKPGRELDALVAEKVMGLYICRCKRDNDWQSAGYKEGKFFVGCWECTLPLPEKYSTDIKAAWEVVEKMLEKGERHFLIDKAGAWLVRFNGYSGLFTPGKSAPHAICLAALRAMDVVME